MQQVDNKAMADSSASGAAAEGSIAKIDSANGDSWPSTVDGYILLGNIGKGAFAKVWQAKCPSKNVEVAVKVMELDDIASDLDNIVAEVHLMRLSLHPNVLSSHTAFVVKRKLWLVMPVMRKGSCLRIMKYMEKAGLGEGLKEDWIATILRATLEGLQYLHQQNKVHRDVKAGNILMDSDGSVKISDFGVAGLLTPSTDRRNNRTTFVGTPCWMAPEVMEESRSYDEKADIWSFGITALELAKGYAPYAKLPPYKACLETIKSPPPSLRSYADFSATKNKFSRHFKELITLCLQKNPKLRPSTATLLTKPFLKKARPQSTLVKELLEEVPIPDTFDSAHPDGAHLALDEQYYIDNPGAAPVFQHGGVGGGAGGDAPTGFVPGTTWCFDDDDTASALSNMGFGGGSASTTPMPTIPAVPVAKTEAVPTPATDTISQAGTSTQPPEAPVVAAAVGASTASVSVSEAVVGGDGDTRQASHQEVNGDTVKTEMTMRSTESEGEDGEGEQEEGRPANVVPNGGGGGGGGPVVEVDDDFAAFEQEYSKSMIKNEEGQADE